MTVAVEPQPTTTPTRADEPAWVLAALLVGAGAVHVAMAPSHLGDATIDGAAFLAAGWAQVLVAVAVVRRPRRWSLGLALAVSLVSLGAWLVSRTVGLPYGAHAGESEPVAFVDGVTAGLEVAAALLAAGGLFPGPARPRRARALAPVAALGVLALATAALASPSAREHGGAGHGDGGHHDEEVAAGHGHGAAGAGGDDLGYAELVNGQMGSHEHAEGADAAEPTVAPEDVGPLAEQLAATAPLVAAYPTLADAEAAGYTQAGPFSPGLGIHYMPPGGGAFNSDGVMDPEDIAGGMLIYDGIEPDARLAGFMYMAYQETEPEGFAGDLDRWHFHTAVCLVVTEDGIETPFGADLTGVTEEMCEAEGGSLMDFSGYMVHVWTVPGYESPEGVFSDLNPRITCPDGTYHRIPIDEIGSADTTCRL